MEDWAFVLLRYWATSAHGRLAPARGERRTWRQKTTSYEVVVAEPTDPPRSIDGREEMDGI